MPAGARAIASAACGCREGVPRRDPSPLPAGRDPEPGAPAAGGHGRDPDRQPDRARPDRPAGGRRLPAQLALARRAPGQGPRSRGGPGVGGDGGGRVLACRAGARAAALGPGRRPRQPAPGDRSRPPAAPARPHRSGPRAAVVDRRPRPAGRHLALAAVRAGPRRLHLAARAGLRAVSRDHQRPRRRQPPAGGRVPRARRGDRARRARAVVAARRRRPSGPPGSTLRASTTTAARSVLDDLCPGRLRAGGLGHHDRRSGPGLPLPHRRSGRAGVGRAPASTARARTRSAGSRCCAPCSRPRSRG